MMDNKDPLFATIWREHQTAKPEPPSGYCEPAQDFADWIAAITRDVAQKRDLISLNQAKVLLIDKFFEYRAAVAGRHRNRLGKIGHPCIFQVFEAGYRQLKLVELSLSPPLLFLPPPPPAAPVKVVKVYKLDSFPIGEPVEDDEDE